jgi:hypothetical protein
MSTNLNISDFSSQNGNQGGAMQLPIRSEKLIMTSAAPAEDERSYHISPALRKHNKYVTVRLKGRGGKQGVFDATSTATYQFLISPSEVQIKRQTIDEQAFSRAGWQIGVWGEDFVEITLSGKTPGKYFMNYTTVGVFGNGLTDYFSPFSASYRNLFALEVAFENNGYWFEGEQAQARFGSSTKFIKAHQDVELTVGEFIWYGMFETLEISENAAAPYLADFHLGFVAWKERYHPTTPYWNALGGEVQRGHVPVTPLVSATVPKNATDTTPVGDIFTPSQGIMAQQV